jgi:hypothetical protein
MTSGYHAYLLRLWRVGSQQGQGWRASLEDPHTRKVLGFNSLEALFAFLQGLSTPSPVSSETSVGSGVSLLNPSVEEFNSDPTGCGSPTPAPTA